MSFIKYYQLKIISLIVLVIFCINSTVYGITLPSKSSLRVPLNRPTTEKRLIEMMHEASEKPYRNPKNQEELDVFYRFYMDKDISNPWSQYLLARTIVSAKIASDMAMLRQKGETITSDKLDEIRNKWLDKYGRYLSLNVNEFPGNSLAEREKEKNEAFERFKRLLTYIFSDIHEKSLFYLNNTPPAYIDYDYSIEFAYEDGVIKIYPMRDETSPDRFIEIRLSKSSPVYPLLTGLSSRPGIPEKRLFTKKQEVKIDPAKIQSNRQSILQYQTNPIVTTPVIFQDEDASIVFLRKKGKLYLPERNVESGESFQDAVENTIHGLASDAQVDEIDFLDAVSEPKRVRGRYQYSFAGYARGKGFSGHGLEAVPLKDIKLDEIILEHREIVQCFIERRDMLDRTDYSVGKKVTMKNSEKSLRNKRTQEAHAALIRDGKVQPTVAPDIIVETYDREGNFQGIILIKRKEDHHWATPGGFARGFESAEQAALRVMSEKAGIKSAKLKRLLRLGSNPSRDPRGYIWSPLFIAEIGEDQVPIAGRDVEAVIKIKDWEEVEYLFKRRNYEGGLWADHLEHLKAYFDYRHEQETSRAGAQVAGQAVGILNYRGDVLVRPDLPNPESTVQHEAIGHINTASLAQEAPQALRTQTTVFNTSPYLASIPEIQLEARYRNMQADDSFKHDLLPAELSKKEFLELKNKYKHIIGGFAGLFPQGLRPEDRGKIRAIFKEYLLQNNLTPENTLILSGGTNAEGIMLFYEVAREMGFKTASIVPLVAIEADKTTGTPAHKLIDADYLYIEGREPGTKIVNARQINVPGSWGAETEMFNNLVTQLFVFGAGGRIQQVVNAAKADNKRIFVIKGTRNSNGDIGINDIADVIAMAEQSGGNVYSADKSENTLDINVSPGFIPDNLVAQRYRRSYPLKQELSKEEFLGIRSRYKHIIAEATFAGRGIFDEDREKIKEILRMYLNQFSRQDTLILSGGTTVGGLNVFNEVARELGFKTAAAVDAIAFEPRYRSSFGIWDADYLYIEEEKQGWMDEGDKMRPGGWGSSNSIINNLATELIAFGGYENSARKIAEMHSKGTGQITVIKGVRNASGELGAADSADILRDLEGNANVKILEIDKPITAAEAKQGVKREKVILVTDIGFDPQAFIALEMILKHPEKYELLGVVTAYSEEDRKKVDYELKAKIAKKILEEHGYGNVPVFSFQDKNKVTVDPKDAVQGYHYKMAKVYLSDDEIAMPGSFMGIKEGAVEFMQQAITSNDKEVSVVGIGPLTPLAAALERNPDIAHSAKQFVLMGGTYSPDDIGYAGYNLRADINAAKRVLNSGANIVLVGTDSTRAVKLNPGFIKRHVVNSDTWFAKKFELMAKLWKEQFGEESSFPTGFFIQDALTTAYLTEPYETQAVVLHLETGSREFMGNPESPALFMQTLPVQRELSNIRVVVSIRRGQTGRVLENLADTVFRNEHFRSETTKRKEQLYRNFFKIRVNPLLETPYSIDEIDAWPFKKLEAVLAHTKDWGMQIEGHYFVNKKDVFNEMIALWAEFSDRNLVSYETAFNPRALANVSDKTLYASIEEFQRGFDSFVKEHMDFFAINGYFDSLAATLKKDVKGVSNVFICYKRQLSQFIGERLGNDDSITDDEIKDMFEEELIQETGYSLGDIRNRVSISSFLTDKVLQIVAKKLDEKTDVFTNELFEVIRNEFTEVDISDRDDAVKHDLYHEIVLANEQDTIAGKPAVLESLAKKANGQAAGKIDREEAAKLVAERIKSSAKLRRKLRDVPMDRIIEIIKSGSTAQAFEDLIKKFEQYTIVKTPRERVAQKVTAVPQKAAQERGSGGTKTARQQQTGGVNLSPNMQQGASTADTVQDQTQEEAPFFTDLTEKAKKGEVDPTYYRDAEITEMVEILNRGQNCNPMVLGQAGTGKTNLVEGLSLRMANRETGSSWIDSMHILSLDMAAFYTFADSQGAGAAIEAFLKKARESNVIIFIDEFHVLAPDKSQKELNQQFFQLLKPDLARGKIRVIATTTDGEFKKYVEGDEAFERRFGTMTLLSMSVPDTIDTMIAIKDIIIRNHNAKTEDKKKHIDISARAVEFAARVTAQSLKSMGQPAVTRDVLDQASAAVFGRQEMIQTKLAQLRKEILRQLNLYRKSERDSYVSGMKRAAERIEKHLEEYVAARKSMEKGFSYTVEEDDIKEIMKKRGIPIGAEFIERLQKLEEKLKRKIKGQDNAIEQVVKTIRRNYSNPRRKQPLGVFYFEGPNGVGKSELAKIVAEELFGNPKALIDDIKGTELMQEHEVSKIIGSPPGYVGSERSGLLVQRVKDTPYSVILFDEVDKAHQKALLTFLGIIEDGSITDQRTQKSVDFSNTIIIFTSNMAKDGEIIKGREGSELEVFAKRGEGKQPVIVSIPGDLTANPDVKPGKSIIDCPNDIYHQFVKLLLKGYQKASTDFATFMNKIGAQNTLLFNKITPEVAEDIIKTVNIPKLQNMYAEGNNDFPLNIEFANIDELVKFLLQGFDDTNGMRPAIRQFEDIVVAEIAQMVQNGTASVLNSDTLESSDVPISKGDTIRVIFDKNIEGVRFEVDKKQVERKYFTGVKTEEANKIAERIRDLIKRKSSLREDINTEELFAILDEKPDNMAEDVERFSPRSTLASVEFTDTVKLREFTPDKTEDNLKGAKERIEQSLQENVPALGESGRKSIVACIENMVEEMRAGIRDQVTRTNTNFLTFEDLDREDMDRADGIIQEANRAKEVSLSYKIDDGQIIVEVRGEFRLAMEMEKRWNHNFAHGFNNQDDVRQEGSYDIALAFIRTVMNNLNGALLYKRDDQSTAISMTIPLAPYKAVKEVRDIARPVVGAETQLEPTTAGDVSSRPSVAVQAVPRAREELLKELGELLDDNSIKEKVLRREGDDLIALWIFVWGSMYGKYSKGDIDWKQHRDIVEYVFNQLKDRSGDIDPSLYQNMLKIKEKMLEESSRGPAPIEEGTAEVRQVETGLRAKDILSRYEPIPGDVIYRLYEKGINDKIVLEDVSPEARPNDYFKAGDNVIFFNGNQSAGQTGWHRAKIEGRYIIGGNAMVSIRFLDRPNLNLNEISQVDRYGGPDIARLFVSNQFLWKWNPSKGSFEDKEDVVAPLAAESATSAVISSVRVGDLDIRRGDILELGADESIIPYSNTYLVLDLREDGSMQITPCQGRGGIDEKVKAVWVPQNAIYNIKKVPPVNEPQYPFNAGDKVKFKTESGSWTYGTILWFGAGSYYVVSYKRIHDNLKYFEGRAWSIRLNDAISGSMVKVTDEEIAVNSGRAALTSMPEGASPADLDEDKVLYGALRDMLPQDRGPDYFKKGDRVIVWMGGPWYKGKVQKAETVEGILEIFLEDVDKTISGDRRSFYVWKWNPQAGDLDAIDLPMIAPGPAISPISPRRENAAVRRTAPQQAFSASDINGYTVGQIKALGISQMRQYEAYVVPRLLNRVRNAYTESEKKEAVKLLVQLWRENSTAAKEALQTIGADIYYLGLAVIQNDPQMWIEFPGSIEAAIKREWSSIYDINQMRPDFRNRFDSVIVPLLVTKARTRDTGYGSSSDSNEQAVSILRVMWRENSTAAKQVLDSTGINLITSRGSVLGLIETIDELGVKAGNTIDKKEITKHRLHKTGKRKGKPYAYQAVQGEFKDAVTLGLIEETDKKGAYKVLISLTPDQIRLLPKKVKKALNRGRIGADEIVMIRDALNFVQKASKKYKVHVILPREPDIFYPSDSEVLTGFKFDQPISNWQLEPLVFEDTETGRLFFAYPNRRRESGLIQKIVYDSARKIGFDNLIEIRNIGDLYDNETIFLTRIAQTYTDEEINQSHTRHEDLFLAMINFGILDPRLRDGNNLYSRVIGNRARYIIFDYDSSLMPFGITEPLGETYREMIAAQFKGLQLDKEYIKHRVEELNMAELQKRLLSDEIRAILDLIHAEPHELQFSIERFGGQSRDDL